jgi:hypothetical protein
MATDQFHKLNNQKQEKIIQAVLKEFAQYGYDSASTNRIVEHANISKGILGGFVALLLASRLPERVGKLLVPCPGAGFQPQSKVFFFTCLMAGLMPSRKRLDKFMNNMTGQGNLVNSVVKEQFIIAMQNALPRNKLFG